MLLHLQPLQHVVLVRISLGHVPYLVPHVLPLDLLHHLRLVLPLLHPQIRVVLVRSLLPPQLVVLVLVRQLLQALLDGQFLLRLSHDLREAHREGVILQVLGVDLMLSQLSLPDLVDVG